MERADGAPTYDRPQQSDKAAAPGPEWAVLLLGIVLVSEVLPLPTAPSRSKISATLLSAQTIRKAAELAMNVDEMPGCPTVDGLVNARRLEKGKTNDPFDSPYRIVCEGDDVHVWSSGRDRIAFTDDDLRDDMDHRKVRYQGTEQGTSRGRVRLALHDDPPGRWIILSAISFMCPPLRLVLLLPGLDL